MESSMGQTIFGRKEAALGLVCTCMQALVLLGCRDKSAPAPAETADVNPPARAGRGETPPADITPPDKPILFQPLFEYAGREPMAQGTGFFVRAAGGRVAAVTSAHFLDFDGTALRRAHWLHIASGDLVATFTKSWGTPGRAGTMSPPDLRSDHF